VQLVDPATRLRLDFFPGELEVLERSEVVDIAGVRVRVLGPDDLLDHKIQLLAESSGEEKHYSDALGLAAMCRRDIPLLEARRLTTTAHSRDLDARCPRCDASQQATFPLAPKTAIFDVLGFV
jgi:hypothetical protein